MNVFLSWSGPLSHDLALALHDWLPSVIQAIKPFVSSEDIEKGRRWNAALAGELANTDVGVICVTRENLHSTWLNFEAGSLAKSLDTSRVMPFLLGLKRSEVQGPLSQFQLTLPEKDDVRRLLSSINRGPEMPLLADGKLDTYFEQWWPNLETALAPLAAQANDLTAATPRSERVDQDAILEELLELSRGQQRAMASVSAFANALSHGMDSKPSTQAIDNLRARWASVELTARRLTDADGKSFKALFDYIEPGITEILREADRAWQYPEHDMTKTPAYRTIMKPIGVDVVALNDFGGSLGDPVVAWIKVDNHVVVEVIAPEVWKLWEATTREHFHQAVRELAATHDLLGRTGQVTLLFDPPPTSVDDGNSIQGEIIERIG